MSSQDLVIRKLLENNVKWADGVVHTDPGFFIRSAAGQTPQVLWIGCSDSRVPESVITRFMPGDIFVHRNIANQIHPDDDNVLSVVEYAVNHLKVKHVIVVGHSECGGVKHAIEVAKKPAEPPVGSIDRWLAALVELVRGLPENQRTVPIVVRKSVERQVENLGGIKSVSESNVKVHGWVYDLSTGHLSDSLDV